MSRVGAERDIRNSLGKRLLVADGSTGTALEALAPLAAGRLALLPLENPQLVGSLHRAYFEAGSDLVETATFSANALSLAPVAGDADPAELAYRVNRAAAEAAARAARDAQARLGGPRWVLGSMGPGDELPSLGGSGWARLRSSYLPQARGLADGGADLAIVETCQDPLQIKAALAALASPEGGRGLPFIVSATVNARGRLLTGTSIPAFVAIVAPFGPLALGLNCSGGPEELEEPLAELAAVSPLPLCFMPNAGLPTAKDGKTLYPYGPTEFGARVEALVRRHGLAIAGGCCGTGPDHIRELARRLADRPAPGARPAARPSLASLYEAQPIGPGLFKIGESASFAVLLDEGAFDEMAERALCQEEAGAASLDLHLSRPGRDEAADMAIMVEALMPRARAALSLDSSSPEVFAAALPLVGGRALLNSCTLQEPARARRVFGLAREYGAAVVCLAVDQSGPARRSSEKARICGELYAIATGECGLPPESLFFDPLAFAVMAGPPTQAAETIAAIPIIKKACPASLTLLGVGNFSYGLPRSLRPGVTAVFLDLARKAGLDAAILDAGGIPEPDAVEGGLRRAVEILIRGEASGVDSLAGILAFAGDDPA